MIDWLFQLLHRYGDIGLFLYCLIGPLTYMPIGPDIFLIARAMGCHCFPLKAVLLMVIAYCVSGSINFFIGRLALKTTRLKGRWLDRLSKAVNRYGFAGLLLISAGPIPLREGSITAGFLRVPYRNFISAMLIGTSLRFTAEGIFGSLL